MKIQIRNGMWETNSSSMHTIVIPKDDPKDPVDTVSYFDCSRIGNFGIHSSIKDGYILIKSREVFLSDGFGWGFDIVSEFIDKLFYAYSSLGPDYTDALSDIVRKYGKDVIYRNPPQNSIIKDLKGIKVISEESENLLDEGKISADSLDVDTGSDFFYLVDHQSQDMLKNYLQDTGRSLEEFLADPKIYVLLDNDNSCYFDTFLDSGVLKKGTQYYREFYADDSDGLKTIE